MPAWHNIDVYSINIDGSDLKRITFDRYYRIGDLSISPDGKTLMATLFEYKGLYSVWQIPIDNPTSRRPLEPDLDLYKSRLPLLNLKAISYDRLYGPEFSPDQDFPPFYLGGSLLEGIPSRSLHYGHENQ